MAQFDLLLSQNTELAGIDYAAKIVNITKGDLLTANTSQTPVIHSVGANGKILAADSTETTGLNWVDYISAHSQLSGLTGTDHHTHYALLAGRIDDVLHIDDIHEYSADAGVTVDEVLLKNGNITITDNDAVFFGTGGILDSYFTYDGSNFYNEVIAGDYYLRLTSDNDNAIVAEANGPVSLYYSDSVKFATSNAGSTTTGIASVTGSVLVDIIVEYTGAVGVTIEGVLLKDNGITAGGVWEPTIAQDLTTKAYVDALAETIVYPVASINDVASDGITGDFGSLGTPLDADILQIEELAADPGFDVRFTVNDVVEFNSILLYSKYTGGSNHSILIELYNPDTTNWDQVEEFTDETAFVIHAIPIIDGDTYIDSGTVIFRIYHDDTGDITHYQEIDYAVLRKTPVLGGGGVTSHGALTGLDVVADHPYALLIDGTRALAGAWDMGNQVLTNVNIDSGVITGITDLLVADGGTGAGTFTDHGVLVGSGTGAITALTVGTDGQLLVGDSANDPVFATLGTSAALSISTGAGTLTINHLTTTGYKHIPVSGASAQILQYSAAGTAKWITVSGDVTIADGGAITIGLNKVHDSMIDWGTGASQVSAVDVPIADSGGYFTGSELETALQEIYPAFASTTIGSSGGTLVGLDSISTPTYNDLQDYVNQFGQRTKITGIDITDNYDGTVNISSGTAWCKTTSSINAAGAFFNFAGGDSDDVSGALTDLSANYIYLDYNGGTPQIVHDTTGALLGHFDHIVLGQVFRHGTHAHIINGEETGLDIGHKTKLRFFQEGGATRVSGMITSSTGTRNLIVSLGAFWMGLTRIVSLSFDSSAVDSGTATSTEVDYLNDSGASFTLNDVNKKLHNTTDDTYTTVVEFMSSTRLRVKDDIFVNTEGYDLYNAWDSWYTDDSGTTWTQVEGNTQIDNANWNDITSGLDALTPNKYAVHWLYLDLEGAHLHMVYGQGDYTAADAEDTSVPSILPNIASAFGVLIAKIIVQEGEDTLIITYPWTSAFSSSLAQVHGNLTGLSEVADHPYALLIDGTRNLTGAWNLDSQNLTNVNIDSGTIDGATIATSDITVGVGKTLDVSAGTLTLANNQISGDKVEGGTINAITITTASIGTLGSALDANSQAITNINIDSGVITGITDLLVADGGTGRSTSTTAYGLIAAGTVATGAHQTLAAGLTTQVLIGGGAAALPAWGTDIHTDVTIGTAYIYRVGGTDISIADGGTGAGTAIEGFDALSPITTTGDIIYGGAAGTNTRLAAGTEAQVLTAHGAASPTWENPTVGIVTSIGEGVLTDISGTAAVPIVDVDLSELATSVSDYDGDFFVVVDDGDAQYKLTKANIALSGFDNDTPFLVSADLSGYLLNTSDTLDGDLTITTGTIKIATLGDGKIPYHVDDATGLVDSPISVSGIDIIITGTLDVYEDGSIISNDVAIFGEEDSTGYWKIRNAGNPTTRRILEGYLGTSEKIHFDPGAAASFFDTGGNIEIRSGTLKVNTIEDYSGDLVTIGNNTAITGELNTTSETIQSTTPNMYLYETDAPADEKYYRFVSSGGEFYIQTRTDAKAVGVNIMRVIRTGTNVDEIEWRGDILQLISPDIQLTGDTTITGDLIVDTNLLVVDAVANTVSIRGDLTESRDGIAIIEIIASNTVNGIIGTDTDHDLLLRRNNAEKLRLVSAGVNITGDTTITGDLEFTTINAGAWEGTAIAIGYGGTGEATATAGFDALSPMTTVGDIIYGGASGTGTRLADGTVGQVLTTDGAGAISWGSAIGDVIADVATTENDLAVWDATSKHIKDTSGEFTWVSGLLTMVGRFVLSDGAGSNSIYIGSGAGAVDDNTNNHNIGIGVNSLNDLTVGTYNIAIGELALDANVSGHYNIAIGQGSLGAFNVTTTSTYNVALGHNSGINLTTGTRNVFIGNSTAGGITTGSNNTIIGDDVDGLAIDLEDNIILAYGGGNIRAQYNGTTWAFTGATTVSNTVTATNFLLSSDERLKTNISTIVTSPIDVEYKEFELISEPGQRRYGILAQDLQKEHPELVREDSEGMLSVAYVDLLVMEVASLKKRNIELENRLSELENKN